MINTNPMHYIALDYAIYWNLSMLQLIYSIKQYHIRSLSTLSLVYALFNTMLFNQCHILMISKKNLKKKLNEIVVTWCHVIWIVKSRRRSCSQNLFYARTRSLKIKLRSFFFKVQFFTSSFSFTLLFFIFLFHFYSLY